MRVEELRIGNWIFDNINKRYVKYISNELLTDEVWVDYANGTGQYKLDLKSIKPILFTEKIILCLNDVRIKQGIFGTYYYIEPFSKLRFYFDEFRSACFVKTVNNESICISRKKYIHSVQNLFHSLVDEDITITL